MKDKLMEIYNCIMKHKAATCILTTVVIICAVWLMPLHAVQVSARIEDCTAFVDGEQLKFYFDIGQGINETDSVADAFVGGNVMLKINPDYNNASVLRIDLEGLTGERVLSDIVFYSGNFGENDNRIGTLSAKYLAEAVEIHDVENISLEEDGVHFEVVGADPYFILSRSGVQKFRHIVDNFWYFKLAVSMVVLFFGILLWIQFFFGADEKRMRSKRIAQCIAVSLFVQIFFGWYVVKNAEDIAVLDSKEPVNYMLEEGNDSFFVDGLKNGLNHLVLQVSEIDADNSLAAEVDHLKVSVLSEDKKSVLAEEVVDKSALAEPESYQIDLKQYYGGTSCFIKVTDTANRDVGVIGLMVQTSGKTIHRDLWIILYAIVCNITLLCAVLFDQADKSRQKAMLLGMYVMTYGMSAFKMWVYKTFIHGFADESYHIGYVAYLDDTNRIIPKFSDMRALSVSGFSAHFAKLPSYNYLGHPPLYYHMLRLAGALKFDGDQITVDIIRMRTFSNGIALIAVGLVLYIGYSRIRKDRPYWHLFYLTSVMCIPMMVYDISGVNNDVLALLGCALFFLGALRFVEEKRNYKTFFLMAVGLSFSLLSKLTAGCVLVIITVLFTVWHCIREKSIRSVFCKQFFATLPVYAVTLFYFIVIYLQTGKIQPRIKDMAAGNDYKPKFYVQFMDRQQWSVTEYLGRFIDKFCGQWTGIVSHISLHHMGSDDGIGVILRLSLWVLPVLLFAGVIAGRRQKVKGADVPAAQKDSAKEILLKCSYLAIILTVIVQMFRGMTNFFYKSGYMGSYQSRYYLCVAMILSYCFIYVLQKWDGKIGKKLNPALVIAAIYFMYSDFIYFLLNYTAFWIR